MASSKDASAQYAVLTLISSTQALRLVRKETRFRTAAFAEHILFSSKQTDLIADSRLSLSKKESGLSVLGDRDDGPFYLEFLPGISGKSRLVARLSGKNQRQLLIDADLLPLSPALPGVFQLSARIDWDGKELLFPLASSIALWQSGSANQMALRFGCAESSSKLRYGFLQSTHTTQFAPIPLAKAEPSFSFIPVSDWRMLNESDPFRGEIRFGRWAFTSGSDAVRMLGFDISPAQ